jgi:hypothetical protein
VSRLWFELAPPGDDPQLRQLLRENPIPAKISVSFEREPNYFIAAQIEGPFHQTCVAVDPNTAKVVGMGSRAIRQVYWNGAPQPVGYLGQLRVHPDYRARRRMITEAFDLLYRLHQDGRAPFYLSSIIEDNRAARRLLTAGLPGLPHFFEYARMLTLAVYCGQRKRRRLALPAPLRLERGSAAHTDQILACLQRNGARRQLAPHWTRDLLFHPAHTPDLSPGDFFLALDGDRVVGCLAAWDQNRFKQTVVRGYAGALARWRGIANVGARLAGLPVLPPIGAPFYHAYASHLAVDDDDPRVFAALLRGLYNHLAGRGYSYFMIGLSEAHPLLPIVSGAYRHVVYPSVLYLVTWEETLGVYRPDGALLPAPEIAVL